MRLMGLHLYVIFSCLPWPTVFAFLPHHHPLIDVYTKTIVTSGRPVSPVQKTPTKSKVFSTDEGAKSPTEKQTENTKVLATSFSLIKAMIGSGVLALPSGVAATSNFRHSLFPAVVAMILLGGLSAYTFALYGRLIHNCQAKSLGDLWEKEKGIPSSWMISVATLTFCFGAALSYSILLADTFPALVSCIAPNWSLGTSRVTWILFLTVGIFYPVCNLKSLSALAPLSIVGVFSLALTTCFLGWRCPSINLLSPYSNFGHGNSGSLAKLAIDKIPNFNTYNNGIISPSSTILVGMASSAYLGHFSVSEFYNAGRRTETGDPCSTPGRGVLKSFYKTTWLGFASTILLNCMVMSFGFLTFGGNSNGVILNNFDVHDPGAIICRLLMAISVTGGYPFLIAACTREFLGLVEKQPRKYVSLKLEKRVTTGIIFFLSLATLLLRDAGFVIGFSGAIMGSLIVYIFPAQLFLSSTSLRSQPYNNRLKIERCICRFLIGFGGMMSIIGGGATIARTFN